MKRYEFHVEIRDKKGLIRRRIWTNGGIGYYGEEFNEAVKSW